MKRGLPAATAKSVIFLGRPPSRGTRWTCLLMPKASHLPSGDQAGISSSQYGARGRSVVRRAGQPPFDGIRKTSERDSPSLMKAILWPSGESAWERIRSIEVIKDRFQPSGGLRSGRLMD